MTTLKFDVFGRQVLVIGAGDEWKAFYSGTEGKRRPAENIVIPSNISEEQLPQYLADLCHEWATSSNPEVNKL